MAEKSPIIDLKLKIIDYGSIHGLFGITFSNRESQHRWVGESINVVTNYFINDIVTLSRDYPRCNRNEVEAIFKSW